MAGNRIGGQRAAATIRQKYGEDHFSRIGSIGGTRSNTGGFYKDPVRARAAGAIGGRISRRGKRGK